MTARITLNERPLCHRDIDVQRVDEQELNEVIEREPEEAVDVAPYEPRQGLLGLHLP